MTTVNPYTRAVETEGQIINLSLYSKQACSLLIELDQAEFLEPRYRGIKKIIDNMFASQKIISTTAVYNEIIGQENRDFFANLMCDQYIGDADTIFMQFQQFHRMVKLQPLIEELNRMIQIGHPDFDEKFEEVSEVYSSSRIVQDAIEMKDLMKRKPDEIKDSFVRYNKFGIVSLEEKLKYLYGGQYITIAAAPGEGKTTMLTTILESIPNSLLISYESTAEELHDVLVSRASHIDSERIEIGKLSWDEQKVVDAARRRLGEELTLKVCDTPLNMSDMFAFIKRQVIKNGVRCVGIDYAQLVPGLPGKGTQTEKFETLSRRIKILARELKIPIIALSSLNKESLKDKRMPTLADLRGSLSFGADADKVIFLYDGACSIGKNRKGKVGDVEGFKYTKYIHTMV